MKKIFYIILLLFSSDVFASSVGPKNEYFLVHDYQDDWQVYNDRMKLYVPYIKEQHVGYTSHTAFCDIQNKNGYKLIIHAKKSDNALFINGSMRQKITAKEWIVMDVDSLYRIYKQPVIYVTLYGSNDIDDKKLYLGYKNNETQRAIAASGSKIIAKPRTQSPYRSFLVITSLIVFVAFAFLSTSYVRAYQRYFNFNDLMTTLIREQSFLISKPLNRMNMSFVFLLSLIMSVFYMLLKSKGIDLFGGQIILQEGDTFGVLMSNYFRMTLVVFVILTLKYFFISLIGQVFNLEKFVDLHYFKIIQSSILFYLTLVLILFALYISYLPTDIDWYSYLFTPVLAFYIVRFVLIYMTIIRSGSVQSFYLISYLCIVELLPIILGIRFAS